MLYHPLRKTLTEVRSALDRFHGHTGPDFLEPVSPELQVLLNGIESTKVGIRAYLEFLHATCTATPNDHVFGPVMHINDVHLAASITVPFALTPDSTVPTESYGPVEFLKEKLCVLLCAIKIYVHWKQYTNGKQPTKWQGFESVIPAEQFSDFMLLDSTTPYLGRLFQNIVESNDMAKTGVEFYLGATVDTL
ncbi:hypothetical protein ON05_006525 [Acaryochloris sp. CCMEE 5410]|nr:hypothetical protein ON05_006525 [Acaryochloris sp. CCMEE 5410]